MTRGFRAICLLFCLSASGACLAAAKAPAKAPAAPATPEAGWFLGRTKEAVRLFYGMQDGTDAVIIFSCAPRSADVVIHVPLASSKARADEGQSVSLTIGGVKSSYAGLVVENEDGSKMLQVTVPARNPMFTALSSPGGVRIETKSFAKIVPLRSIGEKLKQFLAGCRK
jgi:hypothetical protein